MSQHSTNLLFPQYSLALVALSIFVAILCSFTAMDLASRASSRFGRAWLAAAALALGGGIWSMHFVGMQAFHLPGVPMSWDLKITVMSFVVAVLFTGISFIVVHQVAGRIGLGAAGLLMGTGIVAMHYSGMAAMIMPAKVTYSAPYVAASVAIAVIASTVALWMMFTGASTSHRISAAVVMGFAISGMHYTGMYAASFDMEADSKLFHSVEMGQTALAAAVGGATLLVLLFATIAAVFDRRFAAVADAEALALRRSEERFRSLYNNAPLPMHATDPHHRIEYVSDAWLKLLGYERQEVLGMSLGDFMTEESRKLRLTSTLPKLERVGRLDGELKNLVTKSGDVRHVLCSAQALYDGKGNVERYVCGLTDVTEHIEAQEALRQAQKIEAIGSLTGGVAHDFNNLLAVILGNLEIAKKRIGDSNPSLAKLIDNAVLGAQRGASLTRRLLAFARRQNLSPEATDVPDLIVGMSDLLSRSLGPEIQVQTNFDLGLPKAFVDRNQLELAILNLAVNARDAMPKGGPLMITVDTADGAAIDRPGKCVRISMKDSGLGMDQETLARATEPFFTTKGVGKGTGLGLSMVHGLAEQSGGRLTISSKLGIGTQVCIWLPTSDAEKDEVEILAQSETIPEHSSMHVLAVDDDPLVLANTVSILEDLGHRATAARNADEALDLLKATSFDLLLTDQAMPGMSGSDLTRIVRERCSKLPVLIVTGYAELASRPDDVMVLNKPFSQDELKKALSSVDTRGAV